MDDQSKYIYHIKATEELSMLFETCDCNVEYDNRPKIEDLDKFKRALRDEFDEAIYNKIESIIDNYLKFYND